jgi:hypothetical protein
VVTDGFKWPKPMLNHQCSTGYVSNRVVIMHALPPAGHYHPSAVSFVR